MTVEPFPPKITWSTDTVIDNVELKDSRVSASLSDSSSMKKCTEPGELEMGCTDKTSDSNHESEIDHANVLYKGFDIIALGATCLSAVQSQVMSTTLNGLPNTAAIRATNAFYLSGLILDLIAACLAFLTSRWFQRLTNSEAIYLQHIFTERARAESEQAAVKAAKHTPGSQKSSQREKSGSPTFQAIETPMSSWERILIPWYSMSLFVPMVFLVLGTLCLIAGLYTYTWSQQPLPVAIVVTFAGISTLPFLFGVFAIGRADRRRRNIIRRLSKMQGDW